MTHAGDEALRKGWEEEATVLNVVAWVLTLMLAGVGVFWIGHSLFAAILPWTGEVAMARETPPLEFLSGLVLLSLALILELLQDIRHRDRRRVTITLTRALSSEPAERPPDVVYPVHPAPRW